MKDLIERQPVIEAIEQHKTKGNVLRRQVLVVEVDMFMNNTSLDEIRESILNQMKDGVVVLPIGLKAKVCDADTLMMEVNNE